MYPKELVARVHGAWPAIEKNAQWTFSSPAEREQAEAQHQEHPQEGPADKMKPQQVHQETETDETQEGDLENRPNHAQVGFHPQLPVTAG